MKPQRPFLLARTWCFDNWSKVRDVKKEKEIGSSSISFFIKIEHPPPSNVLQFKISCPKAPSYPFQAAAMLMLIDPLNCNQIDNINLILNFEDDKVEKTCVTQFTIDQLQEGGLLTGDKFSIRFTITPPPKTPNLLNSTPNNKISNAPDRSLSLGNSKSPNLINFCPYVGLANQGHTCFANVILQTLFHIPEFCRTIFSISPNNANEVITALQRLFFKMASFNQENIKNHIASSITNSASDNTSSNNNNTENNENQKTTMATVISSSPCRKYPSTRELTSSLPWSRHYFLAEGDSHEFFRDFIDEIEKCLKDHPDDLQKFSGLFRMVIENVITTTNPGNSENEPEISKNNDVLYDISVPVDKETLNDALNDYFSPDQISPTKTISKSISKCPPLLPVHLNRFKYDEQTNKVNKINSSFEFTPSIDLSRFCSQECIDRKECSKYELVSFIAHRGYATSGHYISYIHTQREKKWYKFDDSHVSEFEGNPIELNFGLPRNNSKKMTRTQSQFVTNKNMITTFSAYILMYVRADLISTFMAPFEISGLSEEIINHMNEVADKSNVIPTIMMSENNLRVSVDGRGRQFKDATSRIVVSVKIEETNHSLYEAFAHYRACQVERIRLWHCSKDNIPEYIIPIDGPFDITEKHQKIYCESKRIDDPINLPENQFIVFLAFFDYYNFHKQIRYIDRKVVQKDTAVSLLFPMLSDLLKRKDSPEFLCYVDDTDYLPRKLDTTKTFIENNIKQFSVLYFQLPPEQSLTKSETEKHPIFLDKQRKKLVIAELMPEYTPLTLDLFFKIRFYSTTIHIFTFAQNLSLSYRYHDEIFQVKVPNDLDLPTLKELVCEGLKIHTRIQFDDNDKLCLLKSSSIANPMTASLIDCNYQTVGKIPRDESTNELYYFAYKFKDAQNDFENKLIVRILYVKESMKRLLHILINKGSTFQDLINETSKSGLIKSNHFKITNFTTQKEITLEELITEENSVICIDTNTE
ncbi:hypothetical protein TRFO_21462 [Tritrichomonas foetus]|uniref:USP domain-containing protein n=1 Tax=Tritrichomonas foetus TaxID=1144522 RepID=A0A1J4KJQ2_9EUKA|nr:hypothetical protein TRFO_21462 [Tritrichomonas foetus]|eukprot:OHT09581.1 hypothetical protein TRFO_21462 [Tritrichomonas foetus]